MKASRIGLSLEGIPYIATAALFALVFAVAEWMFLAVVMLVVVVFCLNFFRDPERVIPYEEGIVVSAADGKVCEVKTMADPFTGESRTTVCVFMNVFNAHVNRAPIQGRVENIVYIPGKFINASLDKASTDNERNMLRIIDDDGKSWTVIQIAGLIARRIVCWADPADELARGQRFGIIKFGSRVDVYLPDGYSPQVSVGDTVLAGQSVIARKTVDA